MEAHLFVIVETAISIVSYKSRQVDLMRFHHRHHQTVMKRATLQELVGGNDVLSQAVPPSSPPAVDSILPSTSMLGPNAPPPGFLRKTFPSFPWYRVPNILTYIRCLAIPLLVGLFYYKPNTNLATGILFAVASATDYLDGYLARRWDISSNFGAFLDPVADKLMVSTSLILLTGRYGKGKILYLYFVYIFDKDV